jgi:hypothetical protein
MRLGAIYRASFWENSTHMVGICLLETPSPAETGPRNKVIGSPISSELEHGVVAQG